MKHNKADKLYEALLKKSFSYPVELDKSKNLFNVQAGCTREEQATLFKHWIS
jgi:hypothetical protein